MQQSLTTPHPQDLTGSSNNSFLHQSTPSAAKLRRTDMCQGGSTPPPTSSVGCVAYLAQLQLLWPTRPLLVAAGGQHWTAVGLPWSICFPRAQGLERSTSSVFCSNNIASRGKCGGSTNITFGSTDITRRSTNITSSFYGSTRTGSTSITVRAKTR